jgi:hypothetical protein
VTATEVAAGLKHGMTTVQPAGQPAPLAAGLALAGAAISRLRNDPSSSSPSTSTHNHAGNAHSQGASGHGASPEDHHALPASSTAKARMTDKAQMTLVSLILLSIGVTVAGTVGSLTAH